MNLNYVVTAPIMTIQGVFNNEIHTIEVYTWWVEFVFLEMAKFGSHLDRVKFLTQVHFVPFRDALIISDYWTAFQEG